MVSLDDGVKLAVAPCGSSEKNCWGWEGVSIFRSVCADWMTGVWMTCVLGYPFIQSVLIQALKQLWDSNHYSSVAMTQLFMCTKNHFDWLSNFGNMTPNPKGNLFLLNCLF